MEQTTKNGDSARQTIPYPIVVHSHLQWEWVWQRPQQLLSRFAKTHPVLFIETLPPSEELQAPRIRRHHHHPTLDNLTVAQVQFPAAHWHDGAYVDRERRHLVQDLLSGPLLGKFATPVQWFYDPMAATAFLGHLDEVAVVYDCMDELSQFKGAPLEIIERERQLLTVADVVFCGGRKLCAAKSKLNANCHFYGCGVEVEHFSKARAEKTPVPGDLKEIPGPRLGYMGVVDERIDYDLLAALADADEDWHIVMIGPTAKVDPAALPRRDNLHWLGGRKYEELPNYLKGLDVCLMPFALNEATEYINPTKALEYMATGRPVVSTAVADVIANFPPVAVAQDAADFIELCREAIEAPDEKKIDDGLQLASENSWDGVVEKMEQHIEAALVAKMDRQFAHKNYLDVNQRVGATLTLPVSP